MKFGVYIGRWVLVLQLACGTGTVEKKVKSTTHFEAALRYTTGDVSSLVFFLTHEDTSKVFFFLVRRTRPKLIAMSFPFT